MSGTGGELAAQNQVSECIAEEQERLAKFMQRVLKPVAEVIDETVE